MNCESPQVLIVDDVCDIVDEILTFLQLNDILGVGASDLGEAMHVLEKTKSIRLVFCDIRLACENGLEIIQRVSQHAELIQRKLKFVFLSGEDMISECVDGDRGYMLLLKPVQPAMLLHLAEQALDAVNG